MEVFGPSNSACGSALSVIREAEGLEHWNEELWFVSFSRGIAAGADHSRLGREWGMRHQHQGIY